MDDYDSIVSVEILNFKIYSLAYKTIITTMMHNLCSIINPTSPYMKNGICQKHYPKSFQKSIKESDNGYSIYHKQNNGHFIEIRAEI